MSMSPAAVGLLRTALRARPTTTAELLALADLDAVDAEAAAAELVAGGFVIVQGDRVAVQSPARVVVARAEVTLKAQAARIEAEHAAVRAELDQLVPLLEDLSVGRHGAAVDVELLHGPMAPREASMRLYAADPSLSSWSVVPDASRLDAPREELEMFLAMLQSLPARDRVVLGPVAEGSRLRENLATVLAAEVDLRVHHHLPSWFAINSDDSLVLPVEWGSQWPTSVMVVRQPALAGVVRELFLSLWSQAHPLRREDADIAAWRPLVQLLATGASLESAARTLDISTRTARRRLNEAMRHYRARTPVELGFALGRSGLTPSAGAATTWGGPPGLSGSGR